jgi:hypothetical protein
MLTRLLSFVLRGSGWARVPWGHGSAEVEACDILAQLGFTSGMIKLCLSLILLTAIAVRAWVYLRSPFSPGMNGAYYLVQARSLLETGGLGIPDMPLTFMIHAAVAWLIQAVTGWEQMLAIELAVKALDSALPPMAAVPVYLLARRWSGATAWTALAAAAAAGLGAHQLTMLGDFEKNALALVWLCWLAWALHVWVSTPGPKTATLVAMFAGLLGLTHVGTLGAACGFSGLTVLLALVFAKGKRPAILRLVLFCALVLGAGVSVVYMRYDAERAVRLVKALSDPTTIEDSKHPKPTMGPIDQGKPGGPPPVIRYAPPAVMLLSALGVLLLVWRKRNTLSPADKTLACAAALTAATLGGPWWDMDKGMRFMLIAAVPCILAVSWCAATLQRRWLKIGIVVLLAAYGIGSAAGYARMGGRPMMTEDARDELLQIRKLVPAGKQVCRHPHRSTQWSGV